MHSLTRWTLSLTHWVHSLPHSHDGVDGGVEANEEERALHFIVHGKPHVPRRPEVVERLQERNGLALEHQPRRVGELHVPARHACGCDDDAAAAATAAAAAAATTAAAAAAATAAAAAAFRVGGGGGAGQ